MRSPTKVIVIALMGAAALAVSSATASAAVACSGNVCWHVTEKYEYPPSSHVTIHEDTWKAGPEITFREHKGRGYWAGDVWTEF
jgi:hypothetical protein